VWSHPEKALVPGGSGLNTIRAVNVSIGFFILYSYELWTREFQLSSLELLFMPKNNGIRAFLDV